MKQDRIDELRSIHRHMPGVIQSNNNFEEVLNELEIANAKIDQLTHAAKLAKDYLSGVAITETDRGGIAYNALEDALYWEPVKDCPECGDEKGEVLCERHKWVVYDDIEEREQFVEQIDNMILALKAASYSLQLQNKFLAKSLNDEANKAMKLIWRDRYEAPD